MKGKRSGKSKQEKEKGLKELEQESTDMQQQRFGQPIPNIEAGTHQLLHQEGFLIGAA